MTLLVGTDAIAFPSPALMASKSACEHTLRVHTVDGLHVGLRGLLECGTVHGGSHHNHLVDCLHDLLGIRTGNRLQEKIRCPIHILDEGVRSSRELASSRADRAT